MSKIKSIMADFLFRLGVMLDNRGIKLVERVVLNDNCGQLNELFVVQRIKAWNFLGRFFTSKSFTIYDSIDYEEE